jgi:hypothetical protein
MRAMCLYLAAGSFQFWAGKTQTTDILSWWAGNGYMTVRRPPRQWRGSLNGHWAARFHRRARARRCFAAAGRERTRSVRRIADI